MFDKDKFAALLDTKGWNVLEAAQRLGVHYTYLQRILTGKEGAGGKFHVNFLRLCKTENLQVYDYYSLD